MPVPIDRSGKELVVGAPVIIRGHVKSLHADNVQVVVETDELDYPNTVPEDLTVSGRVVITD